MRRNNKIPGYVLEIYGMTPRQWRGMKRRQLKALIKAFNEYRQGSAYCPSADGAVGQIQGALDRLKPALSVKEWGN